MSYYLIGITTSLLALMRDIQRCIDFLPGSTIPNKPTYRINLKEFDELHKQVTKLLDKGLIRESMSPCAVPALLVPKHGGTFRMCIDSRAVNKITVKYRFPIPRFDDLIDQLHGATIFSKIDLQSGYHQICVHPEDEWRRLSKYVMVCTNGWRSILDGILQSMPKGGKFKWTMEADSAFAELKKQVTEAPVLALPNFDEVFQVECDASLGLYQYSTYDKEFYAIVRSLDYWRHYLLSNEFIPLLRP
ncbi:retrovirus-related pol polyprotein from transposon 17.6 [Tanacetum coccineum]